MLVEGIPFSNVGGGVVAGVAAFSPLANSPPAISPAVNGPPAKSPPPAAISPTPSTQF